MMLPPRIRALLATVLTAGATLGARSGYHAATPYVVLTRTYIDSGDVDFAAVDARRRRLFGTGSRVVDLDSYQPVAMLPPHTGHGFAIAPDLGIGVGRKGVGFSLTDYRQLWRVPLDADVIVYDGSTRRAFFLNNPVQVLDVTRGVVLDSMRLDSGMQETRPMAAASDGHGRLYMAVWTTHGVIRPATKVSQILVVDPARQRILQRWTLPECVEARGLSVDVRHERLFVSCAHAIAVLNTQTGRLLAAVVVPGSAESSALDVDKELLFNPTGAGGLVMLDASTRGRYTVTLIASLPGFENAVAVDSATHRVIAVTRQHDSLTVVVLAPST